MSIVKGRWAWRSQWSDRPIGMGGNACGPVGTDPGSVRRASRSGSGGSHGLCCGGIARVMAASRIASTSTLRSVISLSDDRGRGGVGGGWPNADQVSSVTHGGVR